MTPTIAEWLEAVGLEQYTPLFVANEVDFRTLMVLTDKDLKELGLPFGPRKRLLNALAELKERESAATSAAAAPVGPERGETDGGERRQLTALFCDMVGFTELASRLDPEILHTIIRRYEDTCAACVTRFEGYVFQRLGDGIVAFFGYPLAHEGEAERAIRAALEILERLTELEVPEAGRLHARIGIATGMVVVSAADRSAVGVTMNLAARLQGIAEPDRIVVSERVHRLAGGAFEYADLGPQVLKGISQPTRAYAVLGTSAAASRFEAATRDGLTPLVGREQEIGLMLDRWRLTRDGEGQVVFLSGEPGIGKSRIVSALQDQLEGQGAVSLRFQCSPYYVNSAFYPCIDGLERILGFQSGESPALKLDKLEALAVERCGRPIEDVRFVAEMLSIPCRDRYGDLSLSPRQRKEETIRALVDLTEAAALRQPGVMLFEDVHWADPTTLEVLDRLVERGVRMPLLVLLTTRPEFETRWTQHGHVTALTLARLTGAQSGTLVSRLSGGKAFPPDLLDQIIEKTDGVPLFVEELTRSILESGTLRDEGDRYAFAGVATSVPIPATLRDLLTARLDRAMPVKEIAQIGAAIGREFSYELLAAVAPLSPAALNDGLARLTESGLAFRRGAIPRAVYTFKHALVQDAAYDSLLKSRRQELHGDIARALEQRFPDTRDTEPELLAQHFTEAGLTATAIPLWRRAGQLAMQRFALSEAAAHLRKGLALLETVPPGPTRDLEELELRTLLGPAVVAQRSWAADEVAVILEPAWALAKSLEHKESYLPVLHGLWVHYLTSARLAESSAWAQEMLSTAAATGDSDLEICGHRAAMTSFFWLGNLVAAREHGDIIRATYDPRRHWHIATLTNSDPLTGYGIYGSQFLWMLGYPDQGSALSVANHAHARRRNHPFDLAFALTLGAHVFEFRGEPDQLLEHAGEGERVGREHGVPVMSDVLAAISKGAAWLREGRIAPSVAQLREGLDRLIDSRQRIWVPYIRALLGEAMARDGDLQEGLAQIEESLYLIEAQDERPHFAEVLRLKGWMLWELGQLDEAQRSLTAAIDFARGQQARSWELRAATTLARLMVARGDRGSARRVLAPVYHWFTEGFGTRDLKEAKALLDDLET